MKRLVAGAALLFAAAFPVVMGRPLYAQGTGCTSRLLVKPVDPEAFRFYGGSLLADLLSGTGIGVPRLRQIGSTATFLAETKSASESARLRSILSERKALFTSVQPDVRLRLDSTPPDDTKWPQQWNLARIGMPEAWDSNTDSSSVVVAVLDTGIDAEHDDLKANLWRAPAGFSVTVSGTPVSCNQDDFGFDAIDGGCRPDDIDWHGTHMAGIIGAAGNNGLGIAGVSWRASIMSIRIFTKEGSAKPLACAADAIEALEFVRAAKKKYPSQANVRVVNASWGSEDESPDLLAAIKDLVADDILFVTTAGNSYVDIDLPANKYYPASWALSVPEIIPTAATNMGDTRFGRSSFGPGTIPIAAPGVLIKSTIPKDKYRSEEGTSMAAAQVSGAAALLIATCGTNTLDTKMYLLEYATKFPGLALHVDLGRRLQVDAAIDACRAALARKTGTVSGTPPPVLSAPRPPV